MNDEVREANRFSERPERDELVTAREMLAWGLIHGGLGGQFVVLLWNALTFSLYLGHDGPYISWWWAVPLVALVVLGGWLRPSERRSP